MDIKIVFVIIGVVTLVANIIFIYKIMKIHNKIQKRNSLPRQKEIIFKISNNKTKNLYDESLDVQNEASTVLLDEDGRTDIIQ